MNIFATIIAAILFLILLTGILYFIPVEAIWISIALLAAVILFHFISRLTRGKVRREPHPSAWQNITSLLVIFLIIYILFAIFLSQSVSNIAILLLIVSLIFIMLMNYMIVPLAVFHKIRQKTEENAPMRFLPSLTVVVPAYNEEKVIARTIENLIEAEYPHKEIIVVDDGSQDDTFQIASKYSNRGIKVVHRPNGGKFAALNTGLALATGEIIVTIDADSLIARSALWQIVKGFEDPNVGGVAGNLKVLNRDKFITKLQALEYLNQIQLVRRAFENFGSLTVASGAFSAFRRSSLEEAGRYDPDYLLEDFDITIKLLKSHEILHGNNEAVCYTEAPETWRDLFKQRLSWYRGDFQNFWKHRDTFFNPRFGVMHKLTFPYMLLSMTLVPLASIVVIVTTIIMLIDGEYLTVLLAFSIFLILQTLQSILSILIGEDDLKLAFLSPLMVIGYKQILDFLMLKSLIDVILAGGVYKRRERVARIGTKEPGKPIAKTEKSRVAT